MIGNRLRVLREEHGLSQKDLAKKLGKSQETISSWEKGRTNPKMKELNKLCELYNCSFQSLTGVRQQDPADITMEDIMFRITTLNVEDLERLERQIQWLLEKQKELQKVEEEKNRLMQQLNRLEAYSNEIKKHHPGDQPG